MTPAGSDFNRNMRRGREPFEGSRNSSGVDNGVGLHAALADVLERLVHVRDLRQSQVIMATMKGNNFCNWMEPQVEREIWSQLAGLVTKSGISDGDVWDPSLVDATVELGIKQEIIYENNQGERFISSEKKIGGKGSFFFSRRGWKVMVVSTAETRNDKS